MRGTEAGSSYTDGKTGTAVEVLTNTRQLHTIMLDQVQICIRRCYVHGVQSMRLAMLRP
jgi:hypothetical protein